MTMWNKVSDVPAPKDRVIQITNGWSWRREDYHRPELKRYDKVLREAAVISGRKIVGGIFLVYWCETSDMPCGGVYVVCGSGSVAPNFRFWSEAENPLTQEDVTPEELVSNMIPDVNTMTEYKPSEFEREIQKNRNMIGS